MTAYMRSQFLFIGDRLWLDFVNSDDARRGARLDVLSDSATYLQWLEAAGLADDRLTAELRRPLAEIPDLATVTLAEARRVRATLRTLAENGPRREAARLDALTEINRVLGTSSGTRRLERRPDGSFVRRFIPAGGSLGAMMVPVAEAAADALVRGELARIRRCASDECARVFFDGTRNASRRWCDMASCGNRAKGARFRERDHRSDTLVDSRSTINVGPTADSVTTETQLNVS